MGKKINPNEIKALALDLDGTTLLPDTTMGERTVRVLKKLISGGKQVFFTTGRAIEGAQRYCTAIGISGPMVFFNGAEIADIPSGKVLEADFLDLDVAGFGIDLARSMGVHFQIYLPETEGKPETLYIDKQSPESEMYRKHTGITPVAQDLKTVIAARGLKGIIKAMYVIDPSYIEDIRQKLTDRFGGRINVIRSYPTFLEILKAGVSKGKGLQTVMRLRGLRAQEVMAFGDEDNDLPMFSVAGFSAAPSNARDKVLEAADIVFGSNAEEGLAAYLEDNFL